jgi:hypothetical protein
MCRMSLSAVRPVEPVSSADDVPARLRIGPDLVRRLAVALIVMAALVRVWVLMSGFFYWDDYIFMGRAARLPLDVDYLLYSHDGHLMPAAFAVTWVVERLANLNFLLPIAVMAVAQLGTWWAWYRVLVRLFGLRLPMLAPLALVLFSSLALPSTVWWAAALNGIPLQLALILAAHGLLTWRAGDRRGGLALAAGATVLALLFFEKGILVAPFLLGLALVLDAERPLWPSLTHTLRMDRALWVAVWGITASYVVAYLVVVEKTPASPNDWAAAATTFGRGFVHSVLPTMTGGPLRWEPVGYGSALAQPPAWFLWASAEALLVLVAATCWMRPRARRAWAFAAAYVAMDLLLFIAGRLGPLVNPAVVQGLRYTADAGVPIGLAVGFALMPLVGERDPQRAKAARRWIGQHRSASLLAAFLVMDLLLTLSIYSQAQFRQIWRENGSRDWVATASAALVGAAGSKALLPEPVPERVLYPLAAPYNRTDWALAPVGPRPAFDSSTTQLRLIDDTGTLVDAVVVGPTALPGPVAGCGWQVDGDSPLIRLSTNVFYFEHTVRIGYIASTDTSATVSLGSGGPVRVPLHAGLNVVFVRLTGGGSLLSITGMDAAATLCVDDVTVGRAVPASADS